MTGDWAQDASCRGPGVDPELFFPVSESGLAIGQVAAAKAVCAQCPVADDCLSWALRSGEPTGIWGGTTPGERRLLRRERQRDTGAPQRAALLQ